MVDSLVLLGLLCGFDGTTLQHVHGEWLAGIGGHKGLMRECLGVCVPPSDEMGGFFGLKGLGELHGGRGLDELHDVSFGMG